MGAQAGCFFFFFFKDSRSPSDSKQPLTLSFKGPMNIGCGGQGSACFWTAKTLGLTGVTLEGAISAQQIGPHTRSFTHARLQPSSATRPAPIFSLTFIFYILGRGAENKGKRALFQLRR